MSQPQDMIMGESGPTTRLPCSIVDKGEIPSSLLSPHYQRQVGDLESRRAGPGPHLTSSVELTLDVGVTDEPVPRACVQKSSSGL